MAVVRSLVEYRELVDGEFAGARITDVYFDETSFAIEARRDDDGGARFFRLRAWSDSSEHEGLYIESECRSQPWPRTLRQQVQRRL